MQKIFIVGNPNTGKSTLFNSLTKSDEHTGNWHGVTVKEKTKIIRLNNEDYEFYDLPGLYSLNTYSLEENVAKNFILNHTDASIIYIIDANNIKRNLYLLLQLLDLNINVKVCINNYEYFKKQGGYIDVEYLRKELNCEVEIIDAKNCKLTKQFLKFTKINKNNKNNLNITEIYNKINKICKNTIKYNINNIYGNSKLDKLILNGYFFIPLFIILLFLCLFFIFFSLGPFLSELLAILLNVFIKSPVVYFLNSINSSSWIIKIFDEAIFSSVLTICSFLPQVSLLYIFLSVLEQSGIISRMAFMLDDFFSKIGLNGKCVYTMLMGFGCNTSATFTSKNMTDKNSQIKTALITPFMSCSAKLPIYSVVASAIFGVKNFWIILGLYLLGIVVSLVLAKIYDSTILKSKTGDFLIEFPPLRFPDIKEIMSSSIKTSKQFASKVFGIIFSMSIIIWLVSNVGFNFKFVDTENSILYIICKKVAWLFKPIGLNSPYIISTLVIGLVAKELIVSSMLIFNRVSTTSMLMSSLVLVDSPINFTTATALSFLVFVLLYCPCVSNIAVLYKEVGKKYATIGVVIELLTAYIISMLVYSLVIGNFISSCISVIFVAIVVVSVKYVLNKLKQKPSCKTCLGCNRCK